jgi:hypothetical protein
MDCKSSYEIAPMITEFQRDVYDDLNRFHLSESSDLYKFGVSFICGIAMIGLETTKKIISIAEHFFKYMVATLALGLGDKSFESARPFQAGMLRRSFNDAFDWNFERLVPFTSSECIRSVVYFGGVLEAQKRLQQKAPESLYSFVSNALQNGMSIGIKAAHDYEII